MPKKDGRKMSHEISEFVRIQAVQRVLKGHESPEKVIESYGLHRTNIYKWLRLHKQAGVTALKSSKSLGKKPKITEQDKRKLQRWLLKNPQQFSFDFGLWTLWIVQRLIQDRFQKKVSVWTVSRVLASIGYTPQKPLYQAIERNPALVAKWLKEEYPRIAVEARREKRKIYFSDEAGFRSTSHRGSTWAPKGKTPVVLSTGQRYGCNSISAITKQGVVRFMVYAGSFDTVVFIRFLKRLMIGDVGKITLIVDGHAAHKTKAVRAFVAQAKGRLKLYYFPPYSPNLNPDEQVWNHLKNKVERSPVRNKTEFISRVKSKLHSLQKNTKLIISFFRHPDVAYVM